MDAVNQKKPDNPVVKTQATAPEATDVSSKDHAVGKEDHYTDSHDKQKRDALLARDTEDIKNVQSLEDRKKEENKEGTIKAATLQTNSHGIRA